MIPVNIPKPVWPQTVAKVANIPKPKARKPKSKVPANLAAAAKEYKAAYKAVYHMEPVLTYDGKWIRVKGDATGFNVKRLKELTALLRNRVG